MFRSAPRLSLIWNMLAAGTFALTLVLACANCNAEDTAPPIDELEQYAFQQATAFAQGSVVSVETFGGQEIVNQQVQAAGPSSGTILTEDGWIITSMFQFRSQPASITVVLPNEDRKAAKLVARDHSRELALLKIDTAEPLQPVKPSDRGQWQVGQWALALGKTFDFKVASCSVGILSAQGRIWNKAIQTDAKISPQNYGGPLIDVYGKCMGILTPINPGIVTEGEVEQWYDSGIGFAVPLEDILARLPRLQSGQDIYPGKAGFRVQGTDEFGTSVVLAGVTPGSPAAKAGLAADDKIIGAGAVGSNLTPIAMHSHLKHVMGPIDAEQGIVFEVERNGERKQFECKLAKELPVYREAFLGVCIEPSSSLQQPVVCGVIPNSPAQTAGIEVGDKLVSVNGDSFDEKNKLESRLAFVDYREAVAIEIMKKDGTKKAITVNLVPHPEQDLEWEAPSIAEPKEPFKNDGSVPIGTVQLPLGDVKNKAFAIVPSTYHPSQPHGLMIVYADAGAQDQKLWTNSWELFAREHRWIIVVAQSAEERSWSFDETELAGRLKAQIMKTYAIDNRRICLAGIDSGTLVAFVAALNAPESFRGLWLSNAKLPPRVKLPPTEPLKAIHLFINGSDQGLEGPIEVARKVGYSIAFNPVDLSVATFETSAVTPKLQRWLRLLEFY